MADDPQWLKLLERLGFNVTKIRWRLYQLERKRQAEKRVLPDSLRWLEYQHAICLHCGAIVPNEDRVCPKCRRRVPGPIAYRALRMVRTVFPKDAPVVSSIFLAAIFLFFALDYYTQSTDPIAASGPDSLVALGALYTAPGAPWHELLARSLTFALFHGGVLHLAFNVLALYQVGPAVEEAVGHRRVFVLITASQLAAAAATIFWYNVLQQSAAFTVGASGFVCGLVGFGIGYCHAQGPTGTPLRNFFLQWAGYVLVLGLFLRANNAAHIGGLLVGLVAGFLIQRERRTSRIAGAAWSGLFAISAIAWTYALAWLAYSATIPQ